MTTGTAIPRDREVGKRAAAEDENLDAIAGQDVDDILIEGIRKHHDKGLATPPVTLRHDVIFFYRICREAGF